jgi:GTPase SAR1 family protein
LAKPKYSPEPQLTESAARQFTDRQEPRDAFKKAIISKADLSDKHHVLTYYGIGGIGKSRLMEELARNLENESDIPYCSIDFHNKKLREQGSALIYLSKELKDRVGVKFKNFGLAYAIYWKRVQPHIPLHQQAGLSSIFEEGDFFTEIIAAIEDAPVIGWVGKTIKFATTSWNKYLKDWWENNGSQTVQFLQDKKPHEIEQLLPYYFSQDIKEYINSSSTPLVIFMDTYEALWEVNGDIGSFHERDEWVRELIANLPEVLWVILGREKIRWKEVDEDWEEDLDQHLLDNLSEGDIKFFLNSCGIENEEIQNQIVSASSGVPFYLDLAVDIYNEISPNREVMAEDFPKDDERLRERFLRYLNTSEKETLKVLAVPRFWDFALFEKLIVEFNTQYPLSAYQKLFRFSFIESAKKQNVWKMHNLMREVLLTTFETETPELYHKALVTVFQDLNGKLLKSETLDDLDTFIEAVYYAKKTLTEQEYITWKNGIYTKLFQSEGRPKIVIRRDRELHHIQNIIHHSYDGNTVIHLFGQAGIGKTVLINQSTELLEREGYSIAKLNFFSRRGSLYILENLAHQLEVDYGIPFPNYRNKRENSETEDNVLISAWLNDLQHWLKGKNPKLVIALDSFEILDNETSAMVYNLISQLDMVTWIVASREAVHHADIPSNLDIHQIQIPEFSESDMRNYLQVLGSLGGGFVLQHIIEFVENTLHQLKTRRTPLYYQLLIDIYFEILATQGREPGLEDFIKYQK